MKIVICGSMTSSRKMIAVEQGLVKNGHEVILPKHTNEYARLNSADEMHKESASNKIEHDLIRDHFNEIKNCGAILIVNEPRHNIADYIGGNSFLEMGFAHVLDKKIFILNSIPDMLYTDEIEAMQPIALYGDLNKI